MADNGKKDSPKDNPISKGQSKKNPSKGKVLVEKEKEVDNDILKCLLDINKNQKAYEAKMDGLFEKVKVLEEGYYDEQYDDYYEEGEVEDSPAPSPSSPKRAKVEENSRFATMARRFKCKEVCDEPIDSTLASYINDLYKNGMDEDQYNSLIKDDVISRPENCESLVTVKTNKLIWDLCSQNTRHIDKKLQNCETSIIKGSVLIAKVVDKLAKMESKIKESGMDVSKLIDQSNDALALFGHSNRQLNLTRKEVLKPELKNEYSHLCNSSVPYTNQLFGDDLSKTAKEIKDSVRIGHRIQHGYRGRSRPFTFRGRLRGRPYRARGSNSYSESKNFRGRGSTRGAYHRQ